MTWFAKRDHLFKIFVTWFVKKSTVKVYLKSSEYIQLLYMHNHYIRIHNCFLICLNSGFFNKSVHKYFERSGPFCKSSHNLLYHLYHDRLYFHYISKIHINMMDKLLAIIHLYCSEHTNTSFVVNMYWISIKAVTLKSSSYIMTSLTTSSSVSITFINICWIIITIWWSNKNKSENHINILMIKY